MIFFLFSFSLSALFGIDFGSEYIKVGMALPGKSVHVVLNQQSKRISPSYFAIWNISNPKATNPPAHWAFKDLNQLNWAFLDAAKIHTNRFPKNGIKGIPPLLGEKNGLTGREIYALMLRHLISTVDDEKWKPETATVVLSVEPNFPFEERIALTEAAKIARINLVSIIDSPTAAANVYALEKHTLYANSPKTVIFLDLGAKHTWAAIYKFIKKGENPIVEQLAVSSNYSLGGNLMDVKISNLLMNKFYETHGIKVESDRVQRRFLEESRRAKELLSLNDKSEVKIDDVVDDLGISYILTRQEFESLISEFNTSLCSLVDDVIKKAGLTVTDVNSIELIGGATRVPYVMQVLMEHAGMSKLNRTMNSDEAIAIGSTYIGASMSSSFIVKSIKANSAIGINVSLITPTGGKKVLFTEDSDINEKPQFLCKVGELGTFTIVSGFNDTEILLFEVVVPKESFLSDEVEIVFGLNNFLVPTVVNATINSKFRAKVKSTSPEFVIDEDETDRSSKFIRKMEKVMKERLKQQQLRSDFESYMYKIRDKIEYNEDFKKVLTEDEMNEIKETLKTNQQWYEATDKPKSYELKKRFSQLQKMMKAPDTRFDQLSKRDKAFDKLNKTLRTVFNSINESWPIFRSWIPEEKMNALWELYNATKDWMDEKEGLVKQAKATDDPIVMDYEIDAKTKTLERLYNQTAAIKQPTQPPKAVKKETSKEDDAQTEKPSNAETENENERENIKEEQKPKNMKKKGKQKKVKQPKILKSNRENLNELEREKQLQKDINEYNREITKELERENKMQKEVNPIDMNNKELQSKDASNGEVDDVIKIVREENVDDDKIVRKMEKERIVSGKDFQGIEYEVEKEEIIIDNESDTNQKKKNEL
ncbi:dnaK protein [Histomonas meleagridis]|uniref:dnaK protein n=1 Tax=Histomonas meleagridis TaxID=135588 RepID=UPI00355954D9|nr:dnaK protein [Histomonas meleagridis]KAH0804524.1 dnaK protein [Histomonas meleagridis]